jgi:hypothetical protein
MSYSDFLTADRDIVKAEAAGRIAVNGHSKKVTFDNVGGDMPPLPLSAQVDTSNNDYVCKWLNTFVEFSREMSPRAYDGFHEAIGIWLLSTVAARRVGVQMGQKFFIPSLYIALTAPTTVFSKSTTVNTGYRVIRAAGLEFLLTPDDATPQAFINDMAGHIDPTYPLMTEEQKAEERQRLGFASKCGWFYEEFGMKLEAMMRAGGFMADFRGMLRVMDDGKERYIYKTMTRRDEVKYPYLSLLANLTPADLRPHAKRGSALWGDGFLARFAFIAPPSGTRPSKGRFPKTAVSIPSDIIMPLKEWHVRLGIPSVEVEEIFRDGKGTDEYSVTVEDDNSQSLNITETAIDSFYNYHDALVDIAADNEENGDGDINGSYGRFAEKALRVAILLASVSDNFTIDDMHWAKAQTITESWRQSLHNLKDSLADSTPSMERQEHERMLNVLKKVQGDEGATPSQIARRIRNLSSAEVEDTLGRMIKGGSVRIVSATHMGTKRYMAAV